jgi:hypothetical protein
LREAAHDRCTGIMEDSDLSGVGVGVAKRGELSPQELSRTVRGRAGGLSRTPHRYCHLILELSHCQSLAKNPTRRGKRWKRRSRLCGTEKERERGEELGIGNFSGKRV